MNSRERFQRTFAGKPVDRPWLLPEGMWVRTRARWKSEGMTDTDEQIVDFDGIANCSMQDMTPPFEQRVIAEEGDKVVIVSPAGQVIRCWNWKDGVDHDPGYQVLDSPVKDMDTWLAVKERMDPDHPDQLGNDWDERVKALKADGRPIRLDAGHSFSIFGFSRELMGDNVYLYFYDQPDLVHTVMDFLAERVARLIERVSAHLRIDIASVWEDMAYKGAPLISPQMFREFMLDPTRRVYEAARRHHVSCRRVDSDGDISKLIPLWLEAGANDLSPFEVAAGMDVNLVRERFGDDFFMEGGFDKRALFRGRAEIDAEFDRLRPALARGKLLLGVDHATPPEVSWENFQYFARRKRELLVEYAGG